MNTLNLATPRSAESCSDNALFGVDFFKRVVYALLLLTFVWCGIQPALADYVGEAQTTKYIDPATQAMIAARYQAGLPGLQVGDEISYIIQFTPVPGGTTEMVGGGAYVTDYIPAGTEVVNAQFVQDNGNGTFTQISPPPVAEVKDVLVAQYSETGIFYSTDPRTAMFTNDGSNAINVLNGYPGPAGGPIAGYSLHNAWDASVFTPYVPNPASVAGCLPLGSIAPLVPSPVAGPDTLITGDVATGQGPWNRISYPGSTFGTVGGVVGPALGCIGGTPTSAGWSLSRTNPLPANTNAVRFAGGQTTVGQLFSVRITLRITQPLTAAGILNNSEVFGGDVSILNTGALIGRSNVWRYLFPSVANASSTLIVVKRIVGMCVPVAPATTCVIQPYSGSSVPSAANLNIRYLITYLNGSGGAQANVQLTDTMPVGGALLAGSETVISGANILPSTATVGGFSFAPLITLGSGSGGSVEFTTVFAVAPPTGVALSNTVTMTSASVPLGAISTATTTPTNLASLVLSKTTNTPNVAPGGVASYSIKIPNTGLAAATTVSVKDTLPSNGLSIAATDRFAYQLNSATATMTSASGVVSIVTPITAVVTAPTLAPFREVVTFTLPVGTTIPSGATLTLNFNSTVGTNMPAAATPYLNDAQVSYLGGTTIAAKSTTSSSNGVAPVTIIVPLTLSKSIDCVYVGAVCSPYSNGASIPSASKIKYRLTYANTSATAISGVLLKDTLPLNTSFVTATAAEVVGAGFSTFGTVVQPVVAAQLLTFGTIASLPPGATGAVTFDVQLGTAVLIPSGTYLTNKASISSTLNPGGVSASLTTLVSDQAKLSVSKTTSTPTIATTGPATYTITVTNTGSTPASNIIVYDELPYTLADGFTYLATSGVSAPMTVVVPVASLPPTQLAYAPNLTQTEVAWNFGVQTLAAGVSFSITFTAVPGLTMTAGNTVYTNDVLVSYNSGLTALFAGVAKAAPVTIPTNLVVSKTIDCIYNALGTICNAYNGSGIIPVNAKVRYKISYKNTAAVAQTNVYVCDQMTANQVLPLTATITQPTLAPTPTGVFADTPVIGIPAAPANALCGFVVPVAPLTGVDFSYPLIASLAAGASGVVYVDMATNASAGAVINNTATIVSTQAPTGQSASVTASAFNVPSLTVSKLTSTPTLPPSGVASYTISITNGGSAPTSALKVYDFLPYSGTVVDTTKRFTYTATTAYSKNGVAFVPTTPIITAVSAPSIAPYNANLNQQQVLWDFGIIAANQLAPGDTLTITFTATIGATMPLGSFNNSVGYEFASGGGPGSSNMNGLATLTISSIPKISISKVVAAFSDPINGTTTPLFIPGSIAQYTVSANNSGGAVDNNTVFIIDSVPTNTAMYVKDLGVLGSGPIIFTQGAVASGLTYSNATDIAYFGITPPATVPAWGYVPVAGANGCDPMVQLIRINPKGIFAGNSTLPAPSFNFNFRVCLQ